MNKIGINQCKDILDSFAWDSTGYEESSGIRAREREDSHVFYFRDWFNIVTDRGLREGRCFKIYQNGFAPKRDKFDIDANVSLCCFDREGFWCAVNDEAKARFLAKFFASQKYTREQRERFLLTYFTKEKYSKSQIEYFLTEYFLIEKYSKKEGKQFLAKCYDECYKREQSAKKLLIAKDVKESKSSTKPLTQERLIAKEIKKYTNLGEDYNRESLYDTIEYCLQNGEDLFIEPSKQAQADVVMNYLKYLDLERQIINLQQQGIDLSREEDALNQEIISLQKQLRGLKTQHTTLQKQQQNLQKQEQDLQEAQDELLM